MAKKPPNNGNGWTAKEVAQLRREAKGDTPTRLIAYEHGRSENAIRNKASEEDISLRPTNQSPYNRRKR